MTTDANVTYLIERTRRYELEDGLRDLQLALLFLLGGLFVWFSLDPTWFAFLRWLIEHFGRQAAWLGLVLALLPSFIALAMLGVMNLLRRRWLWRQSGMVKPMRWIVPTRVSVLAALILVASIGLGFGLRQLNWVDDTFALRVIWTATGWAHGYTTFAVGRHVHLNRYIRLGITGGLASTILLFLPLAFNQAGLAFGLLWGILLGVSGATTLRAWLRSTGNLQYGG